MTERSGNHYLASISAQRVVQQPKQLKDGLRSCELTGAFSTEDHHQSSIGAFIRQDMISVGAAVSESSCGHVGTRTVSGGLTHTK